MTIEELTTLEKLNNAFYSATKASKWKPSTQRYRSNLLQNNLTLQEELRNGTYRAEPTVNFWINERGKKRYIESPKVKDRIVQKVLTTEILLPYLTRPLIYDNYASLKGRGVTFARKRINIMLRRFIQEYGIEGYVLLIDVKEYFASIDHEILKEMVHARIHEPEEIMGLIDYVIDTSSATDKGLNLGSEAPQIFSVFYLSPVDNYIKTVRGCRYCGRYADDMIIIARTKEELKDLQIGIEDQLKKLKLRINEHKTQIIKLSRGFTYLQIKYSIDPKTLKIIKRPTHKKIARERKRLKKFRKLYDNKILTELEIHNAYKSWRNSVTKDCNACKRTIRSTDRLYEELFPEHEQHVRQTRQEILKEIRKEYKDDICRRARERTHPDRERSYGLYGRQVPAERPEPGNI